MNKDKLKLIKGYHVKLNPPAKRLFRGTELPCLDDDWEVGGFCADGSGIELMNICTHHHLWLAFDQIHHFTRDLGRDRGDLKYGILELDVRITQKEIGLEIAPLPRSYFRQNARRGFRARGLK